MALEEEQESGECGIEGYFESVRTGANPRRIWKSGWRIQPRDSLELRWTKDAGYFSELDKMGRGEKRRRHK